MWEGFLDMHVLDLVVGESYSMKVEIIWGYIPLVGELSSAYVSDFTARVYTLGDA